MKEFIFKNVKKNVKLFQLMFKFTIIFNII